MRSYFAQYEPVSRPAHIVVRLLYLKELHCSIFCRGRHVAVDCVGQLHSDAFDSQLTSSTARCGELGFVDVDATYVENILGRPASIDSVRSAIYMA